MSAERSALLPVRGGVVLGVLGLTLGACAAPAERDPSAEAGSTPSPGSIDPDPVPVQSPAEEVDLDAIQLPVHLSDFVSVDPGWDTPPQVHDGVFLGPREEDGRLVLSAVSADGTVLWTAQRPLSCTGFALTSAGDRALAVLTDVDPPNSPQDSSITTTASAYDLHTGEPVWGPVEVPGPHQGPGLVFAEPHEEPMGGTGRRVALDPETGERSPDGDHVVGEFFGTTVTARDGELIASDSEGQLWRAPSSSPSATPDPEIPISPATNRLPPGTALLGSPADGYDLWDLSGGELLAEGIQDAMFDLMSETWVAIRGDELVGFDSAGGELWSLGLDAEPEILGVGGVMAYTLADGDALDIYNVVTGNTARIYDPLDDGATAIPLAFTDTGATVVDTGTELFLVTDEPGPPEDAQAESEHSDERP
ncbi:hypothetical protein I2485_13205 [Nesterenkonia sp. E16_7]|uniref:hypothetical protein n=1 Tax=unclassified Nesterenkonia TaxID=2629769 RepID=UPI001A926079|nr:MULTISPECIES: hypothetical protein [unclassified Nesterenkonia]MBO0595801.1 hypothetical protein [Nesterenkonia sp. E16_10]MBO0599600.1 hypothetical protein [Nesterenkonia sp. E16_7]